MTESHQTVVIPVPTDFRIYDKPHDGLTKNDHLREMLRTAHERGFRPRYVLFDSWYSSLENLKAVRGYGWRFLCRLESNRLVNPDKSANIAIREAEIPPEGRIVHLKAYRMVKVFSGQSAGMATLSTGPPTT